MKHLRLARLLPWLVISLCPPLLGHCGGAVEHGTETGNPPVVDQQKLHLIWNQDGVEVMGDAGAVSPDATVVVTNTSSGEQASATAGSDGTVRVRVPGVLTDEYEVTVTSEGKSFSVRLSAATSASDGGASGTDGAGLDLANASCETLLQSVRERAIEIYSSASTACQSDRDCVYGNDIPDCYYTCGGPLISATGSDAARQTIVSVTAPQCGAIQDRCPRPTPPPCDDGGPIVGCIQGSCQELSCRDLQQGARERVNNAVTAAAHDCTVDADCTLISASLRCVQDCGNRRSVASTAADALSENIRSLESKYCSEFQQRACPADIPLPCTPSTGQLTAACVAGQCDVKALPFP